MRHGVELLVDVREAVLFLLRASVRGGGVELVLVEARRRGRGRVVFDDFAIGASRRRRDGVISLGKSFGAKAFAGVLGCVSLSWPAPGLARGQPLHACGGWLSNRKVC